MQEINLSKVYSTRTMVNMVLIIATLETARDKYFLRLVVKLKVRSIDIYERVFITSQISILTFLSKKENFSFI